MQHRGSSEFNHHEHQYSHFQRHHRQQHDPGHRATGTPLTPGFNTSNPSNCPGDTPSIIEGTVGFWYRFYNGPKGRLQWGPQYSCIDRNTWRGVGGNPSANENMFFTSFRYYLP